MSVTFQGVFARYPGVARRVLEIVPGALTWSMLLAPLWASFLIPYALAFFLLLFNLFWLYKSLALMICCFIASTKIQQAEQGDWLKKASRLPHFSRVTHVLIIPA